MRRGLGVTVLFLAAAQIATVVLCLPGWGDQDSLVKSLLAGVDARSQKAAANSGCALGEVYIDRDFAAATGRHTDFNTQVTEYQWWSQRGLGYRIEQRQIWPPFGWTPDEPANKVNQNAKPSSLIATADQEKGYLIDFRTRLAEVVGRDEAASRLSCDPRRWLEVQVNGEHSAPIPQECQPVFRGWEKIQGHRAALIAATHCPGGQSSHQWWICPDLDYLVLREEWRYGKPTVRILDTVVKIADVDGLHYAAQRVEKGFRANAEGTEVLFLLSRMTLSNVKFAPTLPRTLFTPFFPLGFQVETTPNTVINVGPEVKQARELAQSPGLLEDLFRRYAHTDQTRALAK